MTTSKDGLEFIKREEGCKLVSYKCPAGVWTIGYGHTKHVAAGMTISMDRAEEYLREDVEEAEKVLNNMHINFRQGQFDALVSFIFNLGAGAFNGSTLKRLIVEGASDSAIAAEFLKWNKVRVNGKLTPNDGLTKRRKEESAAWVM